MTALDKLLTIAFILSISLVGLGASERTDDEDFSYDPGSENGPAHWGELREEWATCGYPLELHMVHENANKEIAVVGVLYRLGQPDPLLDAMEGFISQIQNMTGGELQVGELNPMAVIGFNIIEYYRYMGSLTTPPCTEGVVWTVVKKIGTVSKRQLRLLRNAIGGGSNARPTQPINGRVIGMYQPQENYYAI